MGNEKVKQNEKNNQPEGKRENHVEWAYFNIAIRLAKEKLSPIGSAISFAIGLFGVLVSPDDYRWHLVVVLVAAAVVFVVYTVSQYRKLNQRCVDFPVQNRPSRHFYTLNGGFEENMIYVLSEKMFKDAEYAFAMGIDQTLALDRSTKKGILNSVLEVLEEEYHVDIEELQKKIYSDSERVLREKKAQSLPEFIDFGDVIDVRVKNGKADDADNKKGSDSGIRLLLIVNSQKKYSDEECQDSEKFESVKGIDSRIIVIKLFEYCRKKNVQYLMLGAMGTNGLNFPLYVIVREIVNAYCYWLGQLAFDSTTPLNVILSLRMEDITRHAGELSKIISYIHWMIDRRKETITK